MTKLVEPSALEALRAENEALREQVEALVARVERAEALADHDVLTPALNRRGFVSQVNRIMAYCRRHEVPGVLLYLDLDRFKQINDDLGHAAGDGALIWVAEVLLAHVRGSDVVGRLGGDEFALVLVNAGLAEGQAKARQLTKLFSQNPFVWEGQIVEVEGSFGVRVFDTQSGAEAWLAEADAAMWLRKKDGR